MISRGPLPPPIIGGPLPVPPMVASAPMGGPGMGSAIPPILPNALPPMAMPPIADQKLGFLQSLAANMAAQNTGPIGITGGGNATPPSTMNDAMAIIEQQAKIIAELQSQVNSDNPDSSLMYRK